MKRHLQNALQNRILLNRITEQSRGMDRREAKNAGWTRMKQMQRLLGYFLWYLELY